MGDYAAYQARFAAVREHVEAMRDAALVPPPVGSGGKLREGYMGGSAYTGASAGAQLHFHRAW